jgi:hypothetical protein
MAGFNSAVLGTSQAGACSAKLDRVFFMADKSVLINQIDQFVLGAEGDVSGSTLKADSICAQSPERIAGRPWIISPHYAREWERQ